MRAVAGGAVGPGVAGLRRLPVAEPYVPRPAVPVTTLKRGTLWQAECRVRLVIASSRSGVPAFRGLAARGSVPSDEEKKKVGINIV